MTKNLIIFVMAVALAYSAMVPSPAGVSAQEGTIPPCATRTPRPTKTPTPEATPTATPTTTIVDPAYWGLDWLPLVGGQP